jgi:hypothetical protein
VYHSVGLISNGSASLVADGVLDGIDVSGEDLFFSTVDSLLPSDGNTEEDVYDARVDGGFREPAAPVACEGSAACQGGSSATPLFGSAGSAGVVGGGNFAPPVASKARVVAGAKPVRRSLTRAQELASALRVCRRGSKRRGRVVCEARARKRYGAKSRAAKSYRKGK